jgi:hypothetical protein
MTEREQSGYDCAEKLLSNSLPIPLTPSEKRANEEIAQEMYTAAEADPFPDDFTKGWQKACLEHGAKI